MILCIQLRKEVTDREQGEAIFELVKQKLTDHPEIKISGHVTNHFDTEEEPS